LRGILCAPSITKSAASLLNKKGYTYRRLDLKALSRLITMKPHEETLDKHLNDVNWTQNLSGSSPSHNL
jgi:RecB family endonuclease NucS